MRARKRTKYVHVGRYVAEVDVELIQDEAEWSPYVSLEGAYRLEDGRKRGFDLKARVPAEVEQ